MNREEMNEAGADAIRGEGAYYCGPGYGTCGEVRVGKDYARDLAAAVLDAVLPLLLAEVDALPTTRTKAWDKGWDSVSLGEVRAILGGDE